MEDLPREVLALVCSHLPSVSLKTLRCTCKALAAVGEEHLFKDLEFRLTPNHYRLYQLEQLSTHPTIAPRLKCLTLESGILLEYSMSLGLDCSSSDDNEVFHSKLQTRFTPDLERRYDLYCLHLDQQARSMAHQRVCGSMTRIMNSLSYHVPDLPLKLIMSERQITLEELEAFDMTEYESEIGQDRDGRRRMYNRRNNCLAHFLHFIEAAQRSNLDVRTLTAVDLPHQLLTFDYLPAADAVSETFRGLCTLDLQIGFFPHRDWLTPGGYHGVNLRDPSRAPNRLAWLLDQSENMTSLRLDFPRGRETEYSLHALDRNSIDHVSRPWLPRLKSLTLSRFQCTWPFLQGLLKDAVGVKTVKLSDCRLWLGSMLDVLHFLSTMKLDSVAVEGRWSVAEDAGEWHAHDQVNFTDCSAANSHEESYERNGMRSKIEHFLYTGGECPLPRSTPACRAQPTWEMQGDTSWHYLPGLSSALM